MKANTIPRNQQIHALRTALKESLGSQGLHRAQARAGLLCGTFEHEDVSLETGHSAHFDGWCIGAIVEENQVEDLDFEGTLEIYSADGQELEKLYLTNSQLLQVLTIAGYAELEEAAIKAL